MFFLSCLLIIRFLDKFVANHCQGVYSDYTEVLKMICKMLDIVIEMFE